MGIIGTHHSSFRIGYLKPIRNPVFIYFSKLGSFHPYYCLIYLKIPNKIVDISWAYMQVPNVKRKFNRDGLSFSFFQGLLRLASTCLFSFLVNFSSFSSSPLRLFNEEDRGGDIFSTFMYSYTCSP